MLPHCRPTCVTSQSGWTGVVGAKRTEAVDGNMTEQHCQKEMLVAGREAADSGLDMFEVDWEMPVQTHVDPADTL